MVAPTIDATETPRLDLLADGLLTTMASIRRSGRRVAGRPVELSTLTGSQVDLVRLVRRRPGSSVAQAADELRLAPNTVSTLVRQLVAAGLLIRSADAADRRVARLELAPAMGDKVAAFRDRRVALLVEAMEQLPAADRRALAGGVGALSLLAAALADRDADRAVDRDADV